MENCEKCWLDHCICKVERTVNHLEYQLHRGNLLQCFQERGASAKRTQADLRESLMASSSQVPRASGKLAAMISSGNREPGNQFNSSVFENADKSNLGRSLVEGNKDHLLSQARSELVRQEHQVGSLNSCISELQQQAHAQRLELQEHNTDIWNLEESKFGYKKSYL